MTQHKRRTAEEQFKYLEDYCLSGDFRRCRECGDVRHIDHCDSEYGDVCNECAPYQRQLDREEREAREEMWAHGHDHRNF